MADLKFNIEFDATRAIQSAQDVIRVLEQIKQAFEELGTRGGKEVAESIAKFSQSFEQVAKVAEAELKPVIADFSKFVSEIDKATPEKLREGFEGLAVSLKNVNFAGLSAEAESVANKLRLVHLAGGDVRMVMNSLLYTIRDLPFGFIGISNNVDMLTQGFINLTRATGSVGNALRVLASQMVGPLGLVFASSALISVLTMLSWHKRKVAEDSDYLKGKFGELGEAINKTREAVKRYIDTLTEVPRDYGKIITMDLKGLDEEITKAEARLSELRQKRDEEIKKLTKEPGAVSIRAGVIPQKPEENETIKNLNAQIEALEKEINRLRLVRRMFDEERQRVVEAVNKFLKGEEFKVPPGVGRIEFIQQMIKVLEQMKEKAPDARTIQKYEDAIQRLNELLKKLAQTPTKAVEDRVKELINVLELYQRGIKEGVFTLEEGAKAIQKAITELEALLKRGRLKPEQVLDIRVRIAEAQRFLIEFPQKQIEDEVKERIRQIRDKFETLRLKLSAKEITLDEFKQQVEKLSSEISGTYSKLAKSANQELQSVLEQLNLRLINELKDQTRIAEREAVQEVMNRIRAIRNEFERTRLHFELGYIDFDSFRRQIDELIIELTKVTEGIDEKVLAEIGPDLESLGLQMINQLNAQILKIRKQAQEELEKAITSQIREIQDRFENLQLKLELKDINLDEFKEKINELTIEIAQIIEEFGNRITPETERTLERLNLRMMRELNEQIRKAGRDSIEELTSQVQIWLRSLRLTMTLEERQAVIQKLQEFRSQLQQKLLELPDTEESRQIKVRLVALIGDIDQQLAKFGMFDRFVNTFKNATDRMMDYWLQRWARGLGEARNDWEMFLNILKLEFMRMISELAVESIFDQLRGQGGDGGLFGVIGGVISGIASLFAPGSLGLGGSMPKVEEVPAIGISAVNVSQVPVIANPQMTAMQVQNQRVFDSLRRIETSINVMVNPKFEQKIETDWVRVSTGLKTAKIKKIEKTI